MDTPSNQIQPEIPESSRFLKSAIVQSVLMVALILGLLLLLRHKSNNYFKTHQDEYVQPWKIADSLRQAELSTLFDSTGNSKQQVLLNQFEVINQLKSHHLLAAKTLYMNYYTFVTIATAFSVFLAISIFLLLKKGWDDPNSQVLKSAFVTNSIITTVLFGYIQVYDLNNNIKQNLEKYFHFERMQIDIHSALMSDTALKLNVMREKKRANLQQFKADLTQARLDSMIYAVNQSIKENRGLFIDVYADKVPKVLEQADKFK